jgi:hypothetical protein
MDISAIFYISKGEESMSRYSNEFATAMSQEEVAATVEKFLNSEGFAYKDYKDGQKVWVKGNPWVAAPQHIRVLVKPGSVMLEAWITTCILPGIFVRELDLDGVYGIAIKKMLKDRVVALERAMQK